MCPQNKGRIRLAFDETIAAIITPPGEGGIAAVRIAGRRSRALLEKHFRAASRATEASAAVPFLMRYGQFLNPQGCAVDEVMAVFMPEGRSYTGLEQVELYCHGGREVVREILDNLLASGARAAEPGEFTRLAFLSGRIDLVHAEAVAEIIAANTSASFETAREHLIGAYSERIEKLRDELVEIMAQVEASIDFPEEEIDPAEGVKLVPSLDSIIVDIRELVDSYRGGRIIREGYKIAIAGRPNSGKSSLFNLMLRQERALVTETAGTTRDYLSEWVELDGFAVNLVDTAGLRARGGVIEKAGQKSAMKIIDEADLILWMFDICEKSWQKNLEADLKSLKHNLNLLLANKIDLLKNYSSHLTRLTEKSNLVFPISCLTGRGIKRLKKAIVSHINRSMPDLTSGVVVTSARHRQKLVSAIANLRKARSKLKAAESPELTAFDLRQAVSDIDEITGRIYTEEILARIFSKFCVGK
ncbi:MAG: tRNA uridine-5-carboxymethylaminomethyl(34) synthesis GTPase MnmE [candidate division Zixibacteria bacterium]|nr:tRNA uridine-5-carboxymethylaminomethyl(34) synthesis GTPase MnmE [candidate division Zixibacteria bacterium]